MKNLGYLISAGFITAIFLLFSQTIVKTEVDQQRIYIAFSKPMNKNVDLWSAIQIDPSACGSWEWLNDSELVFTADSLFAENTIYIVSLSSHMIDSEEEVLSPYSFYFINKRDEYKLYRGPLQWEDLKYPDVAIDWGRGLIYYTLKSRYRSKHTIKTQPQIKLDFLWQKKFYGPLRNCKEVPLVKFDSSVTERRLIVIKEGEEIWQRKLDWQQCILACTNDNVSHIAAFGKTREGQRLYIFDSGGKTRWKYPLLDCNLMNFSSSGVYLAAVLRSNDMCLFNAPMGRILWHKKLPDSDRVTSVAVSNNGEVSIVFDNKSTSTGPLINSSKLLLYDKKGDKIWQGDFQSRETKAPEIQFTDIGDYFIIYNDTKLYCFKIIRYLE